MGNSEGLHPSNCATNSRGASDGGQPISHPSLYGTVEWRYPPGAPAPFVGACPNAQF